MAPDPVLISALEPDQLSAATMRPFPRRKFGKGTLSLMIMLRVYVAIAIPIVAYAFVHALVATQ